MPKNKNDSMDVYSFKNITSSEIESVIIWFDCIYGKRWSDRYRPLYAHHEDNRTWVVVLWGEPIKKQLQSCHFYHKTFKSLMDTVMHKIIHHPNFIALPPAIPQFLRLLRQESFEELMEIQEKRKEGDELNASGKFEEK